MSLSYYNTYDSTLRYTSSSFENFGIDTALASVRFVTLSGFIDMNDLNNIHAYINGTECSFKIINSLPILIREKEIVPVSINIYPNPARDELNIVPHENVSILLLDINGRQVFACENLQANQNFKIMTRNYSDGIYLLEIFNGENSMIKKIIIEN